MSVEIVSEIWDAMSDYLCNSDRVEAADVVVSILIDRDISAEEIRTAFEGNKYITEALSAHLDTDHHLEEDDEEDYNDFDDEFDEGY